MKNKRKQEKRIRETELKFQHPKINQPETMQAEVWPMSTSFVNLYFTRGEGERKKFLNMKSQRNRDSSVRTELYLSNKIHYNCKKINKNDAYGQISYFLNVKKIQDLLKKEEKDKVEKEEGEQQEQERRW